MSLQRKLKNALDETRLLILGAQVLFEFQFNGMFQEAFADLHVALRLIACAGLVLIMVAIGLLIAPSMQHRIVECGENSNRILSATTTLAALALFNSLTRRERQVMALITDGLMNKQAAGKIGISEITVAARSVSRHKNDPSVHLRKQFRGNLANPRDTAGNDHRLALHQNSPYRLRRQSIAGSKNRRDLAIHAASTSAAGPRRS